MIVYAAAQHVHIFCFSVVAPISGLRTSEVQTSLYVICIHLLTKYMATHLLVCILLAITYSLTTLFAAETRKELRTKEMNHDTILQPGHSIHSNKINPSRSIQLSWRPRVFVYRGFLSDEECDHLISVGHGKQERPVARIDDSGKVSKLPRDFDVLIDSEDEITTRIEERISAWTFLPKDNSKPLNVMRFGTEDDKQKYNYFGNKSQLPPSEPTMATVILYLSNVSQGGQILFPESDLGNSHTKNKIWSDCTKSSNTVRPMKGNAILFFNLHPNATPDSSSSHARCPVLEGEMWCATKFFHVKAVGGVRVQSQAENSDCTDEDENCPRWAAIGECRRNSVFMIGSPDYYGTCRKSCNAC